MISRYFIFFWVLISLAARAEGDIQMIWNDDPIKLDFPINAEKRINFPESIAELDVPEALQKDAKIMLSPKGVLHWTMPKASAQQRVYATSISGSVYILDITASENGNAQTVTIVDPAVVKAEEQKAQASKQAIPDFLQAGKATQAAAPGYIQLAQFAMAHHVGPERLIPPLSSAQRVAIQPVNLTRLVRMTSELELVPLAQWKVGSLYVTSLSVTNNSNGEYQFDPRALRGEILFSSALHSVIGDSTTRSNETIWALVTPAPFSHAVGGY